MSLLLKPHKAKSSLGMTVWWYEYEGYIEIHVVPEPNGEHNIIRISRRALEGYIRRATEEPNG